MTIEAEAWTEDEIEDMMHVLKEEGDSKRLLFGISYEPACRYGGVDQRICHKPQNSNSSPPFRVPGQSRTRPLSASLSISDERSIVQETSADERLRVVPHPEGCHAPRVSS